MTTYERFLRARKKFERLAGQYIVERTESATQSELLAELGPIDGRPVMSTDMDALGLVIFCRVSQTRKNAALTKLRAL